MYGIPGSQKDVGPPPESQCQDQTSPYQWPPKELLKRSHSASAHWRRKTMLAGSSDPIHKMSPVVGWCWWSDKSEQNVGKCSMRAGWWHLKRREHGEGWTSWCLCCWKVNLDNVKNRIFQQDFHITVNSYFLSIPLCMTGHLHTCISCQLKFQILNSWQFNKVC